MKGQVRIEKGIIHPGSLKHFGYTPLENEIKRFTALRKAVKHFGKGEVIKKLVAISNLTQKSQPHNHAVYLYDLRKVQALV